MWNCLDLKCPDDDLIEYKPHEMFIVDELRDVVTTLTTAADILTSENPLWDELFVLRNIQVKYKRLFRCDKCLVYLHRVSHCLKKMVLLNLSKSYLDLAERFLLAFSSQDPVSSVTLPSRQQVQYILIRTLSSAKLICDGIKYSRETFCFIIQKLKVGHRISDLVIAGSLTARLVVLLKGMLEQIYDIYQKVLTSSYKLKNGTYQWPEDVRLPKNLKFWVETTNAGILKPLPISQSEMNMLSSLQINSNDENKESDTESIILVNEVENSGGKISSEGTTNGIDYGEVIPREKTKNKKKSGRLTAEQKSLLRKILHVHTLEDLEDMWNDIIVSSGDNIPKVLSDKKQNIVSNLFLQIRSTLSKKNKNKKSKQPIYIKNALSVFSQKLGFTQDQIEMCLSEPPVSINVHLADKNLGPVSKLKELKSLYKQLCDILQFSNEIQKRKKLQKVFKRRLADIRLLRQNGEKNTAKKLIFCTSKVFLTLCQT